MTPPAASAPPPTVEEGRAQPETNVFAYRLKMLRSERRQSLQDVASAIDGTKAHVWNIEAGRSANPSLSLMKALARHFNVSIAYLIGESATRFSTVSTARIAVGEETELSYSGAPMPPDGVEGCVYCGVPLKEGDLVLPENEGGLAHETCCGPERDGYVGEDGDPLKDGVPIPTGYPWKPHTPAPSPTVEEGMREAVAHDVGTALVKVGPGMAIGVGVFEQVANYLLRDAGPIASALAARERERDEARAAAMSWKSVSERLSAYIGRADTELDRLRASAERKEAALRGMTEHYCQLVNSGDAGFWNPEDEAPVVAALTPKEPNDG